MIPVDYSSQPLVPLGEQSRIWELDIQGRPLIWALSGSGPDGAEEIKRHVFYSTIDWNVSVFLHPSTPVRASAVVGGSFY